MTVRCSHVDLLSTVIEFALLLRRILHSKGELSEDRHKQYEEFATSYQKLLANTQSLADLLDENMPELPQDKTVQEGVYSDVFLVIVCLSFCV